MSFLSEGDDPSATPSPAAVTDPRAPTESPTPTPEPTPTALPRVSQAEANQLVRDYFGALESKDFARMREMTAGQASEVTDEVTTEVQQAEETNAVTLDAQTESLELVGGEERDAGVAVDADFAVAINAKIGPLSIQARTIAGQATFLVEQINGRPLITRIEGDFQ